MTKKTESRVRREQDKIRMFHALFEKCLSLTQTIRAAYHMAEDLHVATGQERFYKNYMSFANSRRHYVVNIKLNAPRIKNELKKD